MSKQVPSPWHQHHRLIEQTVRYAQAHSPFYAELFRAHPLPEHKDLTQEDFEKIPTIGKDELQQRNTDFLCVPATQIAEYTATTGTLGNAVTIALTEKDLERLALNEVRSFELMELSAQDKVQLLLTLDRQFMAGMAYYTGLRKAGIASVRSGPALPSVQLETARMLQTTVWIAVPSFVLKILDYAEQHQFDLSQLAVKKILCIGENIRDEALALNSLAQRITQRLPVQLFSTYASTEMQTAFTECRFGCGAHCNTDLLYAEILDEDGKAVEPGSYGELVVTTLGVEAMPLLRYRSGDIVRWYTEPCACGNPSPRISPVLGRKNQMIKYKGTTLFPPLLHHVLHAVDGVKDYVAEVQQDAYGQDAVSVYLAVQDETTFDVNALKEFLKSRLRFVPHLEFKSEEAIHQLLFQSGTRKAQRFIDLRKNRL